MTLKKGSSLGSESHPNPRPCCSYEWKLRKERSDERKESSYVYWQRPSRSATKDGKEVIPEGIISVTRDLEKKGI